ncbi:MAG: hypothetical protein ABI333_22640 [bacterium]
MRPAIDRVLVLLTLLALPQWGCEDNGVVGPDAAVLDAMPLPDAAPVCVPNNDGIITKGEMPMVAGISVDYLVNAPGTAVPVAPDGTIDGGGERSWDFSATGGQVLTVSLEAAWTYWFAGEFTDPHYVSRLAPGNDTLGVYRATDDAIWLLGFASPQPDVTLAVYDDPVPLIRFPVSEGQSWAVAAQITDAVYDNQPFASTDTYNISVDQRGTLDLPYLSAHNTLRIRVELHQSLPGGQTIHRFQYLYVHECYGELGRIVSLDNELDPHFATAAEFRRLALP